MTVSSSMGEFLDAPLDVLWGAGQGYGGPRTC